MPDHIIESIFESLDSTDRKSLSETCRKMNGIFNQPKYLNKYWLNLRHSEEEILKKSSRLYTNVILADEMTESMLQHLVPHIKCLTVQLPIDQHDYPIQLLLEVLSRSSKKLTHFEFVLVGQGKPKAIVVFNNFAKNAANQTFTRFKMEKLQCLTIDCRLFEILDNHNFIDFGTDIRKITIYADPKEYRSFARIRALVIEQKTLKSLSLQVCGGFFNPPLSVQCQLKELELVNFRVEMSKETQTNFLDFLESQDELEVLDVKHAEFFKHSARLRRYQQKRLNMKLKRMHIQYSSMSKYMLKHNCIDKKMLEGPPNLTVMELYLKFIHEKREDLVIFFSLILAKFPNAKCIEIDVPLSHWGSLRQGFPTHLDLTNFSEVRIKEFSLINIIRAPKLRNFSIDYPTSFTRENFKQFIVQHSNIKTLEINFRFEVASSLEQINHREDESLNPVEIFFDLIELALTNLKCLKLISVNEADQVNEVNEIHQWACAMYKHFKKDAHIEKISSLMTELAQPGFHFCSTEFELFKRYDMQIVQKIAKYERTEKINKSRTCYSGYFN